MQEHSMDISLAIQKKSKGYMFYYPNCNIGIVETGNAKFIENGEISRSSIPQQVEIKEVRVHVSLTCASNNKVSVILIVVTNNNEEEQSNDDSIIQNSLLKKPQEVALRMSQRERDQLFRMTMWYINTSQKVT